MIQGSKHLVQHGSTYKAGQIHWSPKGWEMMVVRFCNLQRSLPSQKPRLSEPGLHTRHSTGFIGLAKGRIVIGYDII